ncbi:MAG: cation:proton antiporter [Caulobacteraceae bacterium]|nr:cation:proton antiporter [Caulobacteraceae bacterium]
MTLIQIAALGLVLISLVNWLNARLLRLSPSIAMVGAGLIGALALLAAQSLIGPFWGFSDVRSMVGRLNFSSAVLDDLLGFLLFAGGLQVDLRELRKRQAPVWTLATLGVVLSTLLVGFGVWAAGQAIGADLPLAWALAFGALISPTDPIAVAGAMRTGAVSPRLGAVLQGEALFNDGVGFVVFTAAAGFAASGTAPQALHTLGAIALESGGALALGWACASLTVLIFRQVDDAAARVAATFALAIGVYVAAGLLHLSGPIAAAVAGLAVGGSDLMDPAEPSSHDIEVVWDVVDRLLNAGLFLLLGLQVFVLPFELDEVGLWAAATLLVMVARLAVVLPWGAFYRFRHEERGASAILTWGGLRGAVSLALALTLPDDAYRDTLLAMTFIVVTFSVVVQGLTLAPMARRWGGAKSS